jgi:hypothetical protein
MKEKILTVYRLKLQKQDGFVVGTLRLSSLLEVWGFLYKVLNLVSRFFSWSNFAWKSCFGVCVAFFDSCGNLMLFLMFLVYVLNNSFLFLSGVFDCCFCYILCFGMFSF